MMPGSAATQRSAIRSLPSLTNSGPWRVTHTTISVGGWPLMRIVSRSGRACSTFPRYR